MDAYQGASVIATREQLRDVVGIPKPRAVAKERHRLEQVHQDWLAASPFCLVATADADGACDVSPKGDPPGFALVLDDTTLAVPERPGNRRLDSLQNILENPHVGLLFLIPGMDETLRVNGSARISQQPELLAQLEVGGK